MSLNGQRVTFEPLRSLAFGSISGAYAAIGTGFNNAARLILIDNLTNANVTISFDGINDHMVVAAMSGRVLDYGSNRVGQVNQLEQSEGTVVYVKGAPGSGSVYVSVIYASTH